MKSISRRSLILWLALAAFLLGPVAWAGAQARLGGPYSFELQSSTAEGQPDAVLWDQPPSSTNRNAYAGQDFESRQDDLDIALADDFSNGVAWHIDAIFVPGDTYSTGCDLSCADRFTWEIYADDGGVPAGDPWGGGELPYWYITLTPGDAQVALSTGTGGWLSDVALTLDVPAYLPPGTWWLVFLPSLSSESCGCEYCR
jgi:hypothetical protein